MGNRGTLPLRLTVCAVSAALRLRNESSGVLCSLTGFPSSGFIPRPELADTRRKQALDMFNLAVRDSFFNDTKYSSRDRSGIHGGLCSPEGCSDLREK